MEGILHFASPDAFRAWLKDNGATSGGVWLLFAKPGGPNTVKPQEALEEALCFGWIVGQMQRIDDTCYRKYFAPRGKNSKWSDKNKATALRLEAQGRMTDAGRASRLAWMIDRLDQNLRPM